MMMRSMASNTPRAITITEQLIAPALPGSNVLVSLSELLFVCREVCSVTVAIGRSASLVAGVTSDRGLSAVCVVPVQLH